MTLLTLPVTFVPLSLPLPLDEFPPEYQHLAQQFDLLYFYPTENFIDIAVLNQRKIVGYSTIDKVCSSLIKKLKTRNYEQATSLLTSFFDSWFEPFADTRRTVDCLTKELFAYINTFELEYAVTMDFNIVTFQNNISSCSRIRSGCPLPICSQFLNQRLESAWPDICVIFAWKKPLLYW